MNIKLLLCIAYFIVLFLSCKHTTQTKDERLVISDKIIKTNKASIKLNSDDTSKNIEKRKKLDAVSIKKHEKYIQITTVKNTQILTFPIIGYPHIMKECPDGGIVLKKGTKLKIYNDIDNHHKEPYLCDGNIDLFYSVYNEEKKEYWGEIFGAHTNISKNLKLEDVRMPKYIIKILNTNSNQTKFRDFINKNDGFYYIINGLYIHIADLVQKELIFSPFSDYMGHNYYCNDYVIQLKLINTFIDTSMYDEYQFKLISIPPIKYAKEKNISLGTIGNNFIYNGKYKFDKLSKTHIHTNTTIPKHIKDYEKRISQSTFSIIAIADLDLIYYFYYSNNKIYLAAIEYESFYPYGDCQ